MFWTRDWSALKWELTSRTDRRPPMNLLETSTGVREILLQIREGDTSATERLFAYSLDRFKLISNRILNTKDDLHFFEESDDLLQDAAEFSSLETKKPRPVWPGLERWVRGAQGIMTFFRSLYLSSNH